MIKETGSTVDEAFVGIDVAVARGKHLPIVICHWKDHTLLPFPLRALPTKPPRGRGNPSTLERDENLAFAFEARSYIEQVCDELGVRPRRVGIDAPSAPCGTGIKRRAAERAMDRAGLSCFATPSAEQFHQIEIKAKQHLARGGERSRLPYASHLWMRTGFILFEVLSTLAPCIEVFPQATVRALGAGQVHKSKRGAAETQLLAAASYTGWPRNSPREPGLAEIGFGPKHDLVDAYLSAWVAALDEHDRIALGTPPDDVIWLPRLQRGAQFTAPAPSAATQSDESPQEESHERIKVCPACEEKRFKLWPLGWDAHAAYQCTGLTASEPEERKAEYRQKFGHLFDR